MGQKKSTRDVTGERSHWQAVSTMALGRLHQHYKMEEEDEEVNFDDDDYNPFV